ncbi:MAG: MFS transporter [Ruminiclostridium sp.]|nr:MFS transporter [Ruminiclostridium sp.]
MDEYKIRKRNIIFMIPEGTLIFTAFTFLDPSSVVAVFIDSTTGSLQLAGAAIAVRWISFLLPQFFIGLYVNNIKNLPRFISIITLALRPLPLLMIPIMFTGFDAFSKVLLLLILFTGFFAGEGLVNIPWWDLFGRTIPGDSRGRVIGWQQFLGGIGSLAGGFVIKFVLDTASMNTPLKYSIIFGLGGLIALFSALLMLSLRDFPREMPKENFRFASSLKTLPSHLKGNKSLAMINIIQIISGISAAVIPMSILFSKNSFGLNTNQVSTLIYLQIAGNLAGGLIWGNLSHRLGNKYVVMISQILGLAIHITALICIMVIGRLTPFAVLGFILFLAGIYSGSWLGFSNYILDISREGFRSAYMLINCIFLFPSTLFYYFAGFVAGKTGFMPLYTAGAVAGLAAFVLSFRLKSPVQIAEMKVVNT